MKYALALLAAASAAFAQSILQFTTNPTNVEAGQPVRLEWTGGDDSPVTITLRRGDSDDLRTVQVITGDADGNEFTWTPQEDLEDGNDYTLEISQGVDVTNYSGRFEISGGQGSGSGNDDDNSSTSTASATSTLTMTTANSTSTRSNIMTMTGMASATGTGTTMMRNTTFSSARPSTSSVEATTTEASATGSSTAEAAATSDNAASHLAAQAGAVFAAFIGIAYLL